MFLLKTLRIIPGVGLGALRFGMTSFDAERIVGKAPESTFEADGPYSYGMLAYRPQGLFLFFDEAHDLRLTNIEVQSTLGVTLFGAPLFPANSETVRDLLSRHLSGEHLEKLELESLEVVGERALSAPSLGGTFYFDESGSLQSFQWGPFPGPQGEILWPPTET